MRLAIIGVGKMGRAIREVARADGHDVVAEVDIGQLSREALKGAEVAIEFTQPDAAADNLLALAGWKIPAVCGTTSWYDRLPEVKAAVEKAGTGLVYAPNFSIGVQLLLQLARVTGKVLSTHAEFAARVVDIHHVHKKDAPSGTAAALRDVIRAEDPRREVPIESVREGEVPGTHELHVEAPGETVLLRHEATDRTVFARGALVAARWLMAKQRKGVFRFDEVLFPGGSTT